MWYPTLDTDGIPALYQGFLERPEVFVDAAPAELTGRPVLVFSHGNRSMAEQNFYLTEHLATRGWVVVAPYHTGNTFTDFAAPVTADTFVTRAQDLTAALDVILSLPTDDPLAALPSAELVVASGHSYGGYTTLAWTGGVHRTCDPPDGTLCDGMTDQKAQALTQVADARVKLAIPMAAGNYVDLPDVSPIDIPVMFMSGALDIAVPDAENGDKYWDSLDGEHDVRINLTTGAHQTFTIACTHLTSLEEGDGCEGDEFMDPGTAQQVITRYFEAFVSLHLFDDDPEAAAIVSGETSLHPDIIVTAKQ